MRNTLDKMGVNEKGTVKEILEGSSLKRRFLDIGFTAGTKVECILVSFGEQMKAYRIKGATIGIRVEDAKFIEVEKCY